MIFPTNFSAKSAQKGSKKVSIDIRNMFHCAQKASAKNATSLNAVTYYFVMYSFKRRITQRQAKPK